MPNACGRVDVALKVVEEYGVLGLDATERGERVMEDARVGFAHPDDAAVDHYVEELVDGDQLAPPVVELADVVRDERRPVALGAQPAGAFDEFFGAAAAIGAHAPQHVERVELHASFTRQFEEQLVGVGEADLAPFQAVPWMIGVAVVRPEDDLDHHLGIVAVEGSARAPRGRASP